MPDEEIDEQPSVRPFWSGTISFGLVSVPVELFPANRSTHVGLRLLGPDGTPLRRRYFSSRNDRELAPEQMVRGYQVQSGQYVVVSDEELEKLEPEKSRDIDLRRFVDVQTIPPLYFERGYFLAPAGESSKAYQLLAAVMEKTRRAGIATFVMRGKEYLIAIVAEKGILRAETMRFQDEIRSPTTLGLPEKPDVPANQIRGFEQLIAAHSAKSLSREELRDETSAALLDLVKKKRQHGENVITSGEAGDGEEPGDLTQALKMSFAGHSGARRKRKPGHATSARKPRAPRHHSSNPR